MKRISTLALTLLLVACAGTPTQVVHHAEDFPTLLKQAEAAVKKSAEADSEWRDASMLIGQAKLAAANGEMEKAIELVKRAKYQGELGYQQAQDQKNARPWLF